MMDITRDVILDLLPLYIADEVSADTRALVEKHLETDPELSRITERLKAMELSGEIPVPLTKEHEMKAYQKTKVRIILFTILTAILMSFTLIALLAFFMLSS
jgi:anti-sigma factor RsiW